MPTPPEHGALLQAFPRTLVVKNWPFLALLMLLGLVPAGIAWNPWLGGNPALAAITLASVAVGVALIGGSQILAESLGAHFLEAIHAHGLLTRRLTGREFVTWDRIERIERTQVSHMARGALITVTVFEIRVRGFEKPVRINAALHGEAPAELIAAHAGVAIGEAS